MFSVLNEQRYSKVTVKAAQRVDYVRKVCALTLLCTYMYS